MARKAKHPEHVNHERWLVSYADFITLLFAFFVVMFAVSQVDTGKVGRFSQSFQEAVEGVLPGNPGFMPGAVKPTLTANGKYEPVPDGVEQVKKAIERRLGSGTGDGLASVIVIRRGNDIVMRLPDQVMFASGEDTLKEPARRAIKIVADELRDAAVEVRIEGHTDTVPIHSARFRSNWELSTARATAVLAELTEKDEFEPSKLAAAGYGEYRPIASNDTVAGRAQNRRVDIVITPVVEHDGGAPAAPPAPADEASKKETGRD